MKFEMRDNNDTIHFYGSDGCLVETWTSERDSDGEIVRSASEKTCETIIKALENAPWWLTLRIVHILQED